MADRTFAKFTFFKLDPAWQRRDPEARAEDKREFLAACEDYADRPQPARLLDRRHARRHRPDAARQSPVLEDIHTFHVVLAQSGLAKWMSIPHSYLAMTKPSPVLGLRRRGPRSAPRSASTASSTRSTRSASGTGCRSSERRRIMAEHIEIGRRYPEITINTAYSFGLDDQEFVVSFECDDPGEFLDLVQELRGSESSAYTLRDIPIFTCVAMSVGRALDALDGAADLARRARLAGRELPC